MSISTREKAARASEVECALPGVGEAGGGVVDGGEDHAAEDGDGALEAGEHREHLHTGLALVLQKVPSEGLQSQRRPLLGPSTGQKCLLALSH